IGERQETATQRSVSGSVEQVNAEWKARFEEIRGEAHNGSQEAELLLKEIKDTKNNENDVCHKLADATRREDELKQQLTELQSQIDLSDNAREEAWKRECEITSNLHESEKRERSVAENLDLAEEEAREAQDLASRLRTEAEELKAKLKQAEKNAVEDKTAREELEETRQDVKREREEFEREKRELTLKTKRLDARVVDLESQVDSAPAERLQMSQRCEELERELDSMRTSLKAMRDEREQLERQAQSAGGGDDSAVKQLEDQVKQLQDDLARKDDQLRKQDAEISASHVATDDSAEIHSRVESLESQVSEAERQRDSVQQQLQESSSVIADLETQLRSTHETAGTDNSTLERIQDLEHEKETLVRSLEQLQTKLNNATSGSETAQGFHNTLFENNLAVSLVVCHPDLTVVNWNRAAEKLWEQDSGSIVGKNLNDLSWPCTSEVIRLSESVLNTNSAATIPKLAFQDVDDETRHVRVSVDPITNPSNEVIGLLIAVDDISGEIERDIEARLQTLYAESLTESLPCALIVLDAKDRITSWNRNAEGLFGFSADEAMGKELFELKTPLKNQTFKKRYVQTKEQGRPKKLRVRLDGAQGKATQCLVTQSPFLGSDDSVRGTVLLLETQEPAKTT
ncbi:MAG: PAS domain-containing protein, partial [Planctomycetes bacterium]|nr:PAS domain-containing protein [Planctomycetota bacterium]